MKFQMYNALTGEWSEVDDGVPEPDPVLPPPTLEDYTNAIQSHVDAQAKSRLYTDGNSLATYAASTIPQWADEAQAFIAWRDTVWAQVYALWADPPATPPTIEELISSLPVINWPEHAE